MDVRNTLAAGAYAQARPQIAPAQQEGDAAATFSQAIETVADTIRAGEASALEAVTTGADPHTLVLALAQSELAVETAVTIRDRVVEAYQEILRMPV